MATRTSLDHPQYDATVQRRVMNLHDRDPLLIPQLFADALPPWYRRRAGKVLLVLLVLCVTAAALTVFRLGVKDTAEGLGRIGFAVLRTFAGIAAR